MSDIKKEGRLALLETPKWELVFGFVSFSDLGVQPLLNLALDPADAARADGYPLGELAGPLESVDVRERVQYNLTHLLLR